MDITKLENLFSKSRLSRYVTACKGDTYKATQLYKYNIQLSQSLYPLISVLEIALRNAIDRELSKHYQDKDWLLTQRNDFANHPNLIYKDSRGNIRPDYFFNEKLRKAEAKLNFRRAPILHGKLLAELTFGFWVKFFDVSPIKILKGVPIRAFTNKPHIKLTTVHSHLNSIVNLRNRISHSEPICFDRRGNICLVSIQKYETDIKEAIFWIDTDMNQWAEKMNFYIPVLNRIMKL